MSVSFKTNAQPADPNVSAMIVVGMSAFLIIGQLANQTAAADMKGNRCLYDVYRSLHKTSDHELYRHDNPSSVSDAGTLSDVFLSCFYHEYNLPFC